LFRSRASSFCRLRLIWDLMFAKERTPENSRGTGRG
jgi:hypothetical protein